MYPLSALHYNNKVIIFIMIIMLIIIIQQNPLLRFHEFKNTIHIDYYYDFVFHLELLHSILSYWLSVRNEMRMRPYRETKLSHWKPYDNYTCFLVCFIKLRNISVVYSLYMRWIYIVCVFYLSFMLYVVVGEVRKVCSSATTIRLLVLMRPTKSFGSQFRF